jgi:hypothetical protein
MKKVINKIVVLTVTLFICTVGYSQTEGKFTIDKTDWKEFNEMNGVVFSQKVVEYHDDINDQHKEYYLVRVTNTTEEEMEINTKKTIWYDGECFNCKSDNPEHMMSFSLDAGEEITGDPVNRLNDQLVIFKKFLNYPKIKEVTKFEFQNLTVKLK